jgi:putative transposase
VEGKKGQIKTSDIGNCACYPGGMARPLRIEFEDAIYHLCARGNARQPVSRDEPDCARFLKLLSESAQRFEAAILCFVLVGNHLHLVRKTPANQFSAAVK